MGIALVVMVVAMVLIYLSLAGFCGSVGSALSRILFGSFGIGAWVIPVWVFVLCLYLIAQAGGRQMPARLLAGAILIPFSAAGFPAFSTAPSASRGASWSILALRSAP